MKTSRFVSIRGLRVVLLLACALTAGVVAARNYNFGLTQVWSECAGPSRFNVRLRFQPVPNATSYGVGSGNQCHFQNAVCGIGGGCGTLTCKGPGPCELVLGQCLQGRGGSWAGIAGAGLSQRAAITAPRRCL
jgi:hypothetical protein